MFHNIEQLQKKFGKIFNFIDFGNVNKWFDKDNKNFDGIILKEKEKLIVDISKLANFTKIFSKHTRFYYGLDSENIGSIHIIAKARKHFNKTITKPLQNIKHYLIDDEDSTRKINHDSQGKFIYIPKCNFDVEICIDAVRFLNNYDTFCLLSSDADFIYLLNFLKKSNKKIILIKGGYAQYNLVKQADLVINAQEIKEYITIIKIKQKSRH